MAIDPRFVVPSGTFSKKSEAPFPIAPAPTPEASLARRPIAEPEDKMSPAAAELLERLVPFVYQDGPVRIEVSPGPEGDNTLTCRVVIAYGAEGHGFLFSVAMLRAFIIRSKSQDGALITPMDSDEPGEYSLRMHYHRPPRTEQSGGWASLDLTRVRRVDRIRRRVTDHLISHAVLRDFERLQTLLMREE
jgi:hypothetical protein